MCGDDAVNEDELLLCSACCCTNLSIYPSLAALGISGKCGICCLNAECCCKLGAPLLMPCCCLGCKCENDGCSVINGQCHVCCLVQSCAIPCNEEVPIACAVLGLTCYPKVGCCMKQKALKEEMSR
ncbi:hypothetical protein ACA910_021143 [Epithemia clementina (nom. ined.)]